tara:strand:- start:819 stop:1199 length:381 start_codon:yes stop_codon:yes gene_type:complete
MEIYNKFIFSSFIALIIQINFFIITFLLDKFINAELSNIIGLSIDLILDYFCQQYVFMKEISFNIFIMGKYLMVEFFGISLNQILFTIYNRNIHKKNYNYTFARITISILIFTLFIFPCRYFIIFK